MRAKNIHLDAHRQEITRKIPGFPVSCYHTTFRSDTYDYIDWHWHVEFQLCLTVSGSVLWHTEAEQTEVPAGQGIFINSQRIHMVRPVGKEASFFCLDIPPDFICPTREGGLYEHSVLPVLQASALDRKLITPKTEEGREILRLLNKMAAVFEEKAEGYEFVLAGHVFLIWKHLWELLAEEIDSTQSLKDERFRDLLLYLQKHYGSAMRLDEMAAHIGFSRSECCRYFKKRAGQTISAYLLQYRIHESMYLLAETDRTIAQIAQDCGFSQQSYYAKKFREQTGMTPRQYRERIRADLA